MDYLTALANGLDTPFGQALGLAIQPTRESSTVRQTVARILEQRGAAIRQRVNVAVDRGDLPPFDSTFLGEMLSGPVHLIVNRGVRPFTRTDAERIVDVVLAGIRATVPSR